jgi:hypothetical protein
VALDDVDGEGVVLAVDDPDGLQADNVRYLVMERAGPPPVLVVTATGDLGREAFYVEQALAASGGRGAAFSVEGVAASALSSWDEARLDRFAAIIVTSTRGLERRGRELLGGLGERRGGILLVAGPGVDGDVAAEVLGADVSIVVPASTDPRDPRGAGRALVPIDARHPVFQAIGTAGASLGGTTFQRVAEVRSAECETIARFTTGEPALVDCSRGGGRTLVFASDLDHGWNDLPRHASFVPFVHEAVRYLSAGHGDVEALIVGQTPLAARPGFVSRPDRGGAERLVAVNPDPRESEPARLAPEAFHEGLAEAADALPAAVVEARQQEDRQHIWRYALLAMIAMLMVESVVASRAV